MSPIKEFSLTYEAPDEKDTLSEGDVISGMVTFTLTTDTKVKRLYVKVKGDARVSFKEGSADNSPTRSAHAKFFKAKESLVEENAEGTVLPQGFHEFKFNLSIPEGRMPLSFTGLHGHIFYVLEAKLSRSWRWPSSAQRHIRFVSKSLLLPEQVMCPQHGLVNKAMGVFSKKHVQMSSTINRKVYSPGDTVSIVVQFHNFSPERMIPQFSLQQQKMVYSADGFTKTCDKSLCKTFADPVKPNPGETASAEMKIPVDAIQTLQHCDLVSVDYYIKVYLDISFATDPEVVIPLIIVPSSLLNLQLGEAVGPYPAGALGGPSHCDFPPPAFPVGPHHISAGSGAEGYPAPYPTKHVNITSDCNNQWPEQAAP